MGIEVDYYDILGVTPEDSPETIKQAYREIVSQFHPDRTANRGNAILKMVNEAFATLSDAEKRSAYDHIRTRVRQQIDTAVSHEKDVEFSQEEATPFDELAKDIGPLREKYKQLHDEIYDKRGATLHYELGNLENEDILRIWKNLREMINIFNQISSKFRKFFESYPEFTLDQRQKVELKLSSSVRDVVRGKLWLAIIDEIKRRNLSLT